MTPVTCRHDTFASLRNTVSSDVQRYLTKSPHDLARGDSFRTRISALLSPEVFPVFIYRIAHYLHAAGDPRFAGALSRLNQIVHKFNITPQSCIGSGLRLPHPSGVTFHGRAGNGLTVYAIAICCSSDSLWGGAIETAPLLGDNVTISAQAVVQGHIQVGSGTTIMHGVELDCDAPSQVLVASRLLRLSIRSAGSH